MITFGLIALASWAVLACIGAPGIAWFIGRLKRRVRATYTDWTLSQPEVPQQEPVPPLVFPADVSVADLQKAALAHDFTEIVRREFPQYRCFRESA